MALTIAAKIRGVTLLELLLVLLLLGLAYGLTGPMLAQGSIGLDMKTAARQLAAGLRKARSTAATERREAVLVLDVKERFFAVTGDSKRYRLPGALDYSLFTAESEQVRAQTGMIRFYPDGSSTGGRITMTSGGHKIMVDIDWLTGRVTVL
jgi:general secretion pathway protein H